MKTGIELIAAERQEQIEKHGRTVEYDSELNSNEQLPEAAAKLMLSKYNGYRFTRFDTERIIPFGWSNTALWHKMMRKSYKDRLIIAGALIAAEIDRIQATESTPKIESEGKTRILDPEGLLQHEDMDIYASQGTKVTVTERTLNFGYDSDSDKARRYLNVGHTYTVDKTEVHNWSTDVWLKEIPDIRFNSVHFVPIKAEEPKAE